MRSSAVLVLTCALLACGSDLTVEGTSPAAPESTTWLVYVEEGDAGARVMAWHGGEPIEVVAATGAVAAWSPADSVLAVASRIRTSPSTSRYALILVRFSEDGPEETIVVDENDELIDQPDWSPDGRHISYLTHDGLQIADVADIAAPEVVAELHSGEKPRWSPSGAALLWRGVDATYVARVEDGFTPRRVTPPDDFESHGALPFQNPRLGNAWSPDGRWFLLGARRGLAVVSEYGAPVGVVPAPDGVSVYGGEWSPDGSYVSFGSYDGEDVGPRPAGGVVVPFDDGSFGAPITWGRTGGVRAWWLDEHRAVTSADDGLRSVDFSTSPPHHELLHPSPCRVTAQPRLEYSVIHCDDSLHVMHGDAIGPAHDVETSGMVAGWSPKGDRFVAIESPHSSERRRLFELDPRTDTVDVVAHDVGFWCFDGEFAAPDPWSPDGSIYYFRFAEGGLAVRSLDAEKPFVLVSDEEDVAVRSVTWQGSMFGPLSMWVSSCPDSSWYWWR
jgi:hypothetical protein